MFAFLWIVAATTLNGCAPTGRVAAGDMFKPPSVLEVQGDWDDLAASVQVGAEQSEMAVVKQTALPDPDAAARFELRTSQNEPVIVEAARGSEQGASSRDLITLRAGVGRFGDDARERALLAKIARRLTDLRGVEFAPIRE